MSDSYVKVFPADPEYMPDVSAQKKAAELVEDWIADTTPPYPEVITTEVEINATKQVRFIDQGMNFDSISCPNCGSTLDKDWWGGEVSRASGAKPTRHWEDLDWEYIEKRGFSNLEVVVPCCNSQISLNDLNYEFPAGFARFSIEVLYPERELEPSELEILEQVLGCKLKQTWARY